MKVTVNETSYDIRQLIYDKTSGEIILIIPSDDPISEVAAVFDTKDNLVEIYDDGDVRTGLWYIHHVSGVFEGRDEDHNNSRFVEVHLNVSSLNDNSETELRTSIDEITDGLIEIAEIVDTLESNYEALAERIDILEARIGG